MPLITFFNEQGQKWFCEIVTKEGKEKAQKCLQKLTRHLMVSGNPRRRLIWLTHGYKGKDIYRKKGPFFEAKDELLKKYPNSIVGIVTWEKAAKIPEFPNCKISPMSRSIPSRMIKSVAGKSYQASAISIWPIGNILAYVNYEIMRGSMLTLCKYTFCIGHSLGSHLCSFYAKMMKKLTNNKCEIEKILALDPAGPIFEDPKQLYKLQPDDANAVEVWHTNTRRMGNRQRIGTVDIFINGGYIQPRRLRHKDLGVFSLSSHNLARDLLKKIVALNPNRCVAQWRCYDKFGVDWEIEEPWSLLKNIKSGDAVVMEKINAVKLRKAGCIQSKYGYRLGELEPQGRTTGAAAVYWIQISKGSTTCSIPTFKRLLFKR